MYWLDDVLTFTKGSYEDHIEQLEKVLVKLSKTGLKVNFEKSFFCVQELEYLGYWITQRA